MPNIDKSINYFSIDEIQIGQIWSETILLTENMVRDFSSIILDRATVHFDKLHAVEMGFSDTIVHGFLVNSLYSHILGMYLPGANTVIHRVEIEMLNPVYINDFITYKVKVDRIINSVKAVQVLLSAVNQSNIKVSKGKALCVFKL